MTFNKPKNGRATEQYTVSNWNSINDLSEYSFSDPLQLTFGVAFAVADVSHLLTTTTPPPPPHPYQFTYTAGRFNGHIDRTHSEVSDGSGVVRGAFSYVDPRQQIRTVEYVADKTGFYPTLSHQPQVAQQTEAVRKATENHLHLYNRIAERNSHPAAEVSPATAPRQSAAVAHATDRHLSLYEQIAADHARIGAEHEAARLAFEATSIRNDYADEYYAPQQHDHQQQYVQHQQQQHY